MPDSRIFERIDLWNDTEPRPAPLLMAIDEALLRAQPLERPLLRHYRWAGRAASFGFAASLAAARNEAPSFELVRRWTGGGVVRHDADWTFSLLVPASHPFASARPLESYCAIHRAVAEALEFSGIPSRLAHADEVRQAASCFHGVSPHDALNTLGAKICGGAQRRCREGLLHQGSIQKVTLDGGFIERLGEALAEQVGRFAPPPGLIADAEHMAVARYAAPDWLGRLP